MRVFLAGASGAIGSRLVPQLLAQGHQVIGTATSERGAERIRNSGAEAVVVNLLDPGAVRSAMVNARPDAAIHEATALANISDFKHFDKTFAQTNRLRTEGVDNFLRAAREAGVETIIAQSYASYRYARTGGPIKTEDDPLDPNPLPGMERSAAAMKYLDRAVTDAGGIILRYGGFYGASNDGIVPFVRKRQFPIVGKGTGYSSFVHLDDAAAATVLALDHKGPAVYNIVDDEPAPLAEWLPELAKSLHAKPPRRVPVWLGKVFAGQALVTMALESRGASNAKAKRELGWELRYPTWRNGFQASYANLSTA